MAGERSWDGDCWRAGPFRIRTRGGGVQVQPMWGKAFSLTAEQAVQLAEQLLAVETVRQARAAKDERRAAHHRARRASAAAHRAELAAALAPFEGGGASHG